MIPSGEANQFTTGRLFDEVGNMSLAVNSLAGEAKFTAK